jgi:integrase
MLTDTAIRNAKPGPKPIKLTDHKGLYIEIKPNGTKAWRYRFEMREGDKKKEGLYALGDYCMPPAGETDEEAKLRRAGGLFTLAEARDERIRLRALVKAGINPVHQRKLDKIKVQSSNAETLESLAKEWLGNKDWAGNTKLRRLQMMQRSIFPKIGMLPVRQITPQHVLDVLKTAEKINGPSVAAEAKRTLAGIFALAVSTLRCETDPVYPVKDALKPVKTQHKRALEPEEIGQLLRDIESHPGRYETTACFQLMWWTLCRPGEAVGARWAEFDLDEGLWVIPPWRMKKRKVHTVPLPPQAVEMLRGLKGVTGKYEHVFVGRDDKTQPISLATFRAALHIMGWSGRYSPHATRTTGSTRLNEMRYHSDVIEAQLAHEETNKVRGTYNHATYLDERRDMMNRWADYLDALKEGNTNVVTLRKAG